MAEGETSVHEILKTNVASFSFFVTKAQSVEEEIRVMQILLCMSFYFW